MKFTKVLLLVLVGALLLGANIALGNGNGNGHDNGRGHRGGRGDGNQQGQAQGQLQGQQQGQITDVDITNKVTNENTNTNVNLNSNDASASAEAGALALNKGNNSAVDVETNIDNSTIIPAPVLPVPGFLNPDGTINGIWTSSPFDLGRAQPSYFTIPELCRIANPSRALGILWYEWTKSFQIEIACWKKAKPQRSIRIVTADGAIGLTKMGEAHARAVELHKSEKQVAAALCVYAAKQGAKAIVIRSFSNPVTKADTAVLGGAGASVTSLTTIVNSAGGFGWTTSERVFRSFVVAELYR